MVIACMQPPDTSIYALHMLCEMIFFILVSLLPTTPTIYFFLVSLATAPILPQRYFIVVSLPTTPTTPMYYRLYILSLFQYQLHTATTYSLKKISVGRKKKKIKKENIFFLNPQKNSLWMISCKQGQDISPGNLFPV